MHACTYVFDMLSGKKNLFLYPNELNFILETHIDVKGEIKFSTFDVQADTGRYCQRTGPRRRGEKMDTFRREANEN